LAVRVTVKLDALIGHVRLEEQGESQPPPASSLTAFSRLLLTASSRLLPQSLLPPPSCCAEFDVLPIFIFYSSA
jgi:hypothetical protein